MKKELFVRMIMLATTLAAIVFFILAVFFDINIPGVMFFCTAAAFVCFSILTILISKNETLKHRNFLCISALILAMIIIALGILDIFL